MSTKTRNKAFAKPKKGRPPIEKPEVPQAVAGEQPKPSVSAQLQQQMKIAPETSDAEDSQDENML